MVQITLKVFKNCFVNHDEKGCTCFLREDKRFYLCEHASSFISILERTLVKIV